MLPTISLACSNASQKVAASRLQARESAMAVTDLGKLADRAWSWFDCSVILVRAPLAKNCTMHSYY